jgi:hypothetical protein
MKQEIAAVRLLQFGLTAANLRYTFMRAVESAEPAELITGDEQNEEDEGARAGGSAEERVLALELREAHVLVLTCCVLEARCKIKITHAGGVKVLTWTADGATFSGAPVISGTSGSRVAAPWSAAAAGRPAPEPAAGSGRRPSFASASSPVSLIP